MKKLLIPFTLLISFARPLHAAEGALEAEKTAQETQEAQEAQQTQSAIGARTKAGELRALRQRQAELNAAVKSKFDEEKEATAIESKITAAKDATAESGVGTRMKKTQNSPSNPSPVSVKNSEPQKSNDSEVNQAQNIIEANSKQGWLRSLVSKKPTFASHSVFTQAVGRIKDAQTAQVKRLTDEENAINTLPAASRKQAQTLKTAFNKANKAINDTIADGSLSDAAKQEKVLTLMKQLSTLSEKITALITKKR